MPMAGRSSGLALYKLATLRVALIALSAVLWLPACGVFASQALAASAPAWSWAQHARHHGSTVTESYCASVGTAAAAKQPSATERGALPVPAPLAPPYPVAAEFPARTATVSSPPPLQVSFYLRSARILR